MQKQINPGDAEQTNRPLANAQHAPDYSTALLSKKIIGRGAAGTCALMGSPTRLCAFGIAHCVNVRTRNARGVAILGCPPAFWVATQNRCLRRPRLLVAIFAVRRSVFALGIPGNTSPRRRVAACSLAVV